MTLTVRGTRLPHVHGAGRLPRSAGDRRRPLRAARLPTERHSTSHPVERHAGARRAAAWRRHRPTCCQHRHRHRRHVHRLLAAVLVVPGVFTTRPLIYRVKVTYSVYKVKCV